MASTYSSLLRLELMATGDQSGTWGTTTNTNLGTLLEKSIAGRAAVSMGSDADYTLTANNGSDDEARCMILNIASGVSLTATRNVICPTSAKLYVVKNATTGGKSIVLKTTAGTGITIPNGVVAFVFCDGTNVVNGLTYLPSITTSDATFTLQDDADATKQMQFQLSGITTATTRTFTVPDVNDTLVTLTSTGTLTNKTLTNPTVSTGTFTSPTITTPTVTNPANTDQTLTDAATVSWDMNSGGIATLTLGAGGGVTRIMGAPTNLKKGTYILHAIQGDATARSFSSWNAIFKWQSATAPTLTSGSGKRDIFSFICDGTNLYGGVMLDVR